MPTNNQNLVEDNYIILTHIHLDHAGGAGALIKHLPNAKVYVHEYGANHNSRPRYHH
jgi:glyoxylase-like metal-dependent hydrolase (beta-lactamase superfamily II)